MKAELIDYLEWDVKSWSKAILFWDKHLDEILCSKICIELGGRRGGLSLWLAEKGAHVICSDIHNPEEEAKLLHNKFNFKEQISYEAVDASNIQYKNKFDIIILKSIIGGIARNGKDQLKLQVVKEIHNALKPGGILLFAENLEASWLHVFFRKKFVRWGKEWNYIKYNEIKKMFSVFNDLNFETNGFLSAFGRKEWQKNLLATIDDLLMNKLVFNDKKYILYGIATK